MIFAYAVADEELLVTAYKEPALLRVSTQVRAEARQAWYEEAELTVMVGSNFADRAKVRLSPGESFDPEHVERLRRTTGLIDIDQTTNAFLKHLDTSTIFRHIKFQVYNGASVECARSIKRGPCDSARPQSAVLQRARRDRESMMITSVSLSYAKRKLRCNIRHGESHPAIYKPKPTMRYRRANAYHVCDVAATTTAALRRALRVANCEKFKGFTLKDLEGIAGTFRFLTPRGKFQDAVFQVMENKGTGLLEKGPA